MIHFVTNLYWTLWQLFFVSFYNNWPVSLCTILVFYIIMSKFQKEYVSQIWRERENSTQPTSDITFNEVITWQMKNGISQLSRRLKSPNLEGIHIRMKQYHSYISRELITWSHGISKTSQCNFQEGYNLQTLSEYISEWEGTNPICNLT